CGANNSRAGFSRPASDQTVAVRSGQAQRDLGEAHPLTSREQLQRRGTRPQRRRAAARRDDEGQRPARLRLWRSQKRKNGGDRLPSAAPKKISPNSRGPESVLRTAGGRQRKHLVVTSSGRPSSSAPAMRSAAVPAG